MINQIKLNKLILKVLKNYESKVAMINDLTNLGLSHHSAMILELLLLNKSYDDIKRVLLFTDNIFDKKIDEIYNKLKHYKSNKSMFDFVKLKGA